jgi:hypothetical protein
VRTNLGIFLDWKTILESRIPMIEVQDANKTPHLFDPASRLGLAGR